MTAIGDRTLAAFVAGELEGEAAASVARAIEADPGLRARAERLSLFRKPLHIAYGPLADEPVPERLMEILRRLEAESGGR